MTKITGPTDLSKPKVLFVDDEPFVLEGLRRALHRDFAADLANGPEEGLQMLVKSGPYPVVVSDMRMPGMDGAEFLSRVCTLSPDSIRVMLTGYADADAAMRAVNEGRIFRFLNKPADVDEMTVTLKACVAHYQLLRSEKDLLEGTLAGAVRVLSEVLNLANPAAFNKASRLRQYVRHMATKLGFGDLWQYEIAALLSELGCLTLTPDLVDAVHAGQTLSAENEERYRKHPKIGHDLLAKIPRLELVAEMILRQNEELLDPHAPATPAEQAIRNGSEMLRTSLAYDHAINGGATKEDALALLSKNPARYDIHFVQALSDFQPARQATELRLVDVREIRTGMILNEDLNGVSGMLSVSYTHLTLPTIYSV